MTVLAQWAKLLALSVAGFVLPLKPLLIGSMVMVLLDMVTGIMAARKRGEKITAGGLRRTITKLTIYTVAIVSGSVAEKLLLEQLVPVARLVAGAIGLVEIKSVLENAQTVLGMTLFQAIMARLGGPNDPKKLPAPAPSDEPTPS